jgi:tetratricopeptide (TPR) repeat protein
MFNKILLTLLASVFAVGCSQNLYTGGRRLSEQGFYDGAIEKFQQEVAANPQNGPAWREMGIAYFKRGETDKARENLERANQIKPDPAAYLYLGMIQEKEEKFDSALIAYSTALQLQPEGRVKSLLRAHVDLIISKNVKREAETAIKNESNIQVSSIPENTVAVVNFDGSSLPEDIAPISAGLAELTAIDLAKVKSLRVVERLKIDAIVNELKLGASGYADPKNAPRMGRLLGSRKIVAGVLSGMGKKEIRLDGAIVDAVDNSSKKPAPAEGKLKEFFKMQKDFVFKVIDEMGITLTPEERNAIKKAPTESYLAFLAYSRGIDYRNRGMLSDAQREFDAAVRMDRNFQEAGRQAQTMSNIVEGEAEGGASEQFESSLAKERAMEEAGQGLDGKLTSMAHISGFIPDDFSKGSTLSPEGAVGGEATVIIKGNLDAE